MATITDTNCCCTKQQKISETRRIIAKSGLGAFDALRGTITSSSVEGHNCQDEPLDMVAVVADGKVTECIGFAGNFMDAVVIMASMAPA